MAPKAKFAEGEKVLCFHGPLIYEAKCLKVETKPQQKYFIHYNGWNKNWDEWVPESRVMKCTEQAYQKQKELQKAHIAAKASKKSKTERAKKVDKVDKKAEKPASAAEKKEKKSESVTTTSRRGARDGGGTPRSNTPVQSAPSTPPVLSATTSASSAPEQGEPKRKRIRGDSVLAPTIEPEETYVTKIEVRIKIPEDLKPWIVDDWDLITRQFRLLNFPPKKSAHQILQDYLKYKSGKGNDDAISEVVLGIGEYFNVMLGAQLLYKFERLQYAELLDQNPDVPVLQLYGGIHLLRLFVKIGGMLAYTRLDEKSMQTLIGHLHDFLKYMSKNAGDLFSLDHYIVASPEYQRKAL